MRLLCLEGQKGCDARALDRGGEFALVLCAGAGHAAGKDLAALADELSELVRLFIVDRALFLAEQADLFVVLSLIVLFGRTPRALR